MPVLTNTTRESISFRTGGTKDEPTFESLASGETRNISTNTDSVQFRGLVAAGAVTVGGTAPKKARRAKTASDSDGSNSE